MWIYSCYLKKRWKCQWQSIVIKLHLHAPSPLYLSTILHIIGHFSVHVTVQILLQLWYSFAGCINSSVKCKIIFRCFKQVLHFNFNQNDSYLHLHACIKFIIYLYIPRKSFKVYAYHGEPYILIPQIVTEESWR